MILHAIFLTEKARNLFADYCLNKGWNSFSDAFYRTYCGEYQIDTSTKSITECIEGRTHPYQLSNESEFNKFIDVLEDKVVARFNEGKVDFTYIEFSLFEEFLCLDYASIMNDLDGESLKDLLSDVRSYANRIVFYPKTRKEYLSKLQLATYQATALILNLKLDPNDFTLDLRVFEPTARVLMFGAVKYEKNNWMKPSADPMSNVASLYRHLRDMRNGEDLDKESKIHHIGHVMCNVMFLTYALKNDNNSQ